MLVQRSVARAARTAATTGNWAVPAAASRTGETSSVTACELDLAWNKLLRAPFSHLPDAAYTPGLHRLRHG